MLKTRDGAERAPLKGDGEGQRVCVAAKGNADEQQRGAGRGARRGGFGKRDGFGKRGGEGSL